MSRDTTIYVGYFLEAERPKALERVSHSECPDHGEIESPFCPTCGKAAVSVKTLGGVFHSAFAVIYDASQDWVQDLPPDEVEWFQNTVSYIDPSDIGGEEEHDYLVLPTGVIDHDIGDGGFCEMDPAALVVPPSQDDIHRIMRLIGYPECRLKFGTIVEVTY